MTPNNEWALVGLLLVGALLVGRVLWGAWHLPDPPRLQAIGVDDWTKYRGQLDSLVQEMRGMADEMRVLQVRNGQQEITIAQLTETLERQSRDVWARDTYLREVEGGLTRIPAEWQSRVLAGIHSARPPVLAAPPVAVRPPPFVRHGITAEALSALISIIAGANWVSATQASRTSYLLDPLPPSADKFTRRLSRSDAADVDLRNMILTAFNFSDDVILGLLDNAATALNGSDPGRALAAWRAAWGFAPQDRA